MPLAGEIVTEQQNKVDGAVGKLCFGKESAITVSPIAVKAPVPFESEEGRLVGLLPQGEMGTRTTQHVQVDNQEDLPQTVFAAGCDSTGIAVHVHPVGQE